MTAQATLDWQHEIHHAIIAALPNRDYELIAFNQAKSTESIYANVLHGQRLFYLRFSCMRMNARAALPMLLLICAAMAVIVSWLQVLEKISSSRNLAASSLAIGILSGWPCWKSWARLAMSRCVLITMAF